MAKSMCLTITPIHTHFKSMGINMELVHDLHSIFGAWLYGSGHSATRVLMISLIGRWESLEHSQFFTSSKSRCSAGWRSRRRPIKYFHVNLGISWSSWTWHCTQQGCYDETGLDPLVSVKWHFNATAYKGIVDNCVIPTLWQQFRDICLMVRCPHPFGQLTSKLENKYMLQTFNKETFKGML